MVGFPMTEIQTPIPIINVDGEQTLRPIQQHGQHGAIPEGHQATLIPVLLTGQIQEVIAGAIPRFSIVAQVPALPIQILEIAIFQAEVVTVVVVA